MEYCQASIPSTRAHLKAACEAKQWDLLDKLLEFDATLIDDNALYTDTWGTWYGMLVCAVVREAVAAQRFPAFVNRQNAPISKNIELKHARKNWTGQIIP